MRFNYKSHKGFTLIELLVVIGILAVLAAIAIPSVAGLIDRANVSADKTNANEMTNAMERFASEYELFCQDIASGTFDKNNMDSAQGRVYNVLGIEDRAGIELVEIDADEPVDDDDIAIYRDTKYPANAKTAQLIVQNYTKTSSSTFEPKQSDMHYWYSPDCGVIVYAEPDAGLTPENVENKLNAQVVSGMDAKGNPLDENTEWIDLTNYAYSNFPQHILSAVSPKEWKGLTNFNGRYVWTDGNNIYYSCNGNQYVLQGDTWMPKTWYGLTSFNSNDIWTYGGKYYYSNSTSQYVLNGDTWVRKSWNGLTSFSGRYIWTDNTNIFFSDGAKQYVLNNDTWVQKNWEGLSSFHCMFVWNDGKNIYNSNGSSQYVLVNGKWERKTWEGLWSLSGTSIWTDGTHFYHSSGSWQHVYDGNDWQEKTWNFDMASLMTDDIWTDGKNTYYSHGTTHYIFS